MGQLLKFNDEKIEQPAHCRQQPAPRREYGMNDAAARQPLRQDFHKQPIQQIIVDQQGWQLRHRDAANGGGFGQGLRWEWQLLALKDGTR